MPATSIANTPMPDYSSDTRPRAALRLCDRRETATRHGAGRGRNDREQSSACRSRGPCRGRSHPDTGGVNAVACRQENTIAADTQAESFI